MKKKELKKRQQLEKQLNKKASITEPSEIKTVVIIIVVILIIIGLFYLIGGLITGEIKLSKKKYTVEEAQIQYQEILLGSSLSQNRDSYYVLYYNNSDPFSETLKTKASTYISTENSIYVYYVDMDNKFNSLYSVSDNESANNNIKNITTVNDLKINAPTMVRVTNGKVSEYIESYETISTFFDNITK